MLELVVLGSGSRGNCTLIRLGSFAMLIDAGFSARQLADRLAAVDQDPARLDSILLTHEHSDHVAGLRVFTRRCAARIVANEATVAAASRSLDGRAAISTFETGEPFTLGPFAVHPFAVPHDAADPVGFVLETDGVRLGFATDLGHVTAAAAATLADCDALVFEANHDRELLMSGPYPERTKLRVASDLGHLSNDHAAAELPGLLTHRTRTVMLAHLSRTNNDPGLACSTVASSVRQAGFRELEITAACQDTPRRMVVSRATRWV